MMGMIALILQDIQNQEVEIVEMRKIFSRWNNVFFFVFSMHIMMIMAADECKTQVDKLAIQIANPALLQF